MRPGIVYLITNKANDLKYVGATFTKLNVRWSQHVHLARKAKSVLGAAILEFGRDSFSIEPLAFCRGTKDLQETESLLTVVLKTFEPHGYNRKVGQKHSDGTKEAMLGRVPWQKGKPSVMRGIPRSKKTRKKISESRIGIKLSAASIAKMVATKTGSVVLKKRKSVVDQHGTIYPSIQECADAIGVHISAVSMAIHGKRKHAKGYVLEFCDP